VAALSPLPLLGCGAEWEEKDKTQDKGRVGIRAV